MRDVTGADRVWRACKFKSIFAVSFLSHGCFILSFAIAVTLPNHLIVSSSLLFFIYILVDFCHLYTDPLSLGLSLKKRDCRRTVNEQLQKPNDNDNASCHYNDCYFNDCHYNYQCFLCPY